MKNSLGTFEYGVRAKWSTFIAVCCFLGLLMLPTIGHAANTVGTTFGRLPATDRNSRLNGSDFTLRRTATSYGCCRANSCPVRGALRANRVHDRCRKGVRPTGTNSHRTNSMRVTVAGRRFNATFPGPAGTTSITIPAGRTVSGVAMQLGSTSGTPHQFRVEIHRVNLRPFSGVAAMIRAQ